MLRPAVSQLISKDQSVYSLVIAVSKRARQIADTLYEENKILEEKPVKTAVDEFWSGKCRMIEDPSLKMNI